MSSLKLEVVVALGTFWVLLQGCVMIDHAAPTAAMAASEPAKPPCTWKLQPIDTTPCDEEHAMENYEACLFIGTVMSEYCALSELPPVGLGLLVIPEPLPPSLWGVEIHVEDQDMSANYRIRVFRPRGESDEQIRTDAKLFFGSLVIRGVTVTNGPY